MDTKVIVGLNSASSNHILQDKDNVDFGHE